MRAEALALALLFAGCVVEEPTDPAPANATWTFEDPIACATPADPFTSLRSVSDRGVDQPIPSAAQFGVPGRYLVSVLIRDLDADGDLDLGFTRPDSGLDAYLNDGAGHFAWLGPDMPWAPPPNGAPERDALSQAFIDLTGDGLPELVRSGWDGVWFHRNLGGGAFGPVELLWDAWTTEYGGAAWATFGFGDVDGDGDLDMALSSLHGPFEFGGNEPPPGFIDLLILLEDGAPQTLIPLGDRGPGTSQLALLTDRDSDGDLDLYIGADLKVPGVFPPGTFWRNDGLDAAGLPQWVDDGDATASALQISHMGAASADIDRDGLLDYCFTIIGPISCLQSDPSGVYVDTTAVHGLTPDGVKIPRYWTGWGLELADLDNDGLEDVVAVAGRSDDFLGDDPDTHGGEEGDEDPVETPWLSPQPNALWQATSPGEWVERTDDVAFGSTRESFGMATADLNGDGALEIVIGNETGLPSIWDAGCTEGAWLQLDLVGAGGDRELVGAQVRIDDGDEHWLREVQSLRTIALGPTRVHVGLGDRDVVDRVTVMWPGGPRSVLEDVPTRRLIRVERR